MLLVVYAAMEIPLRSSSQAGAAPGSDFLSWINDESTTLWPVLRYRLPHGGTSKVTAYKKNTKRESCGLPCDILSGSHRLFAQVNSRKPAYLLQNLLALYVVPKTRVKSWLWITSYTTYRARSRNHCYCAFFTFPSSKRYQTTLL